MFKIEFNKKSSGSLKLPMLLNHRLIKLSKRYLKRQKSSDLKQKSPLTKLFNFGDNLCLQIQPLQDQATGGLKTKEPKHKARL